MLIDIGQIEGAFVMGLGNLFRESNLINLDGSNSADTTWEYKPPCSLDIPIDFRVEILNGEYTERPFGIKATGEPPLLLSYSAATALKLAINDSRIERGLQAGIFKNHPFLIDYLSDMSDVKKSDLEILKY